MTTTERPRRADAERNVKRLLEAGAQVFASTGTTLPLEEVARVAGVGKGTLYRHFPTREHLLAALLAATFADLADRASQLRAELEPMQAYEAWLAEFDRMPAGYRGLRSVLVEALGDDASVIATACGPMKEETARILADAQGAGMVREDITANDLLAVVAGLPEGLRRGAEAHPWLGVLIDGTRTPASARSTR